MLNRIVLPTMTIRFFYAVLEIFQYGFLFTPKIIAVKTAWEESYNVIQGATYISQWHKRCLYVQDVNRLE